MKKDTCILPTSAAARQIDKISKTLNVGYNIVSDIVKEWFDTHTKYKKDGSVAQSTFALANMPSLEYIKDKIFNIQPIETSDGHLLSAYVEVIKRNTNIDNANVFIFSSEKARQEYIQRLLDNGFIQDSIKQFNDYEGRPCFVLAEYKSNENTQSKFKQVSKLNSVLDKNDLSKTTEKHALQFVEGQDVYITSSQLNAIVKYIKLWNDVLSGGNKHIKPQSFVLKQNGRTTINSQQIERMVSAISDLLIDFSYNGVPQSLIHLLGSTNINELIQYIQKHNNKLQQTNLLIYSTDSKGNEIVTISEKLMPLVYLYKTFPMSKLMNQFEDTDVRVFDDVRLLFDDIVNGEFSNTPELFDSFTLKSSNINDITKANVASLYIGYGVAGTTANDYMQQFLKHHMSISGVFGLDYTINTDVVISPSDIVFVYVDKNKFLYKEREATQNAIRYVLDHGGQILLDGNLNNPNDTKIQQWIQNEFGLKPSKYHQYNIYKKDNIDTASVKKENINNNHDSPFVIKEVDNKAPYNKSCIIEVSDIIPITKNDLLSTIKQVGPSARIAFRTKDIKSSLLLQKFIDLNNDIMLYKIPNSGKDVFIDFEDKNQLRTFLNFAKENNIRIKSVDVNGKKNYYITEYEYTTYLSDREIVRNQQYEKLFNTQRISSSELNTLSKAAIFKLSDFITHLMESESYKQDLINVLKLKQDAFQNVDFSKLTRIEVIQRIGFDTLLTYINQKYFNPRNREDRMQLTPAITAKLNTIHENFSAFIEYGQRLLVNLESISLSGNTNVSNEIYDLIDPESEQEIQEIFGSSLEHWQVGFRQVSVFSSLSSMIKNKINNLYELDSNGKPIKDQYGFEKHIDSSEAVARILQFVQYAYDIDDMIQKLQIHVEAYPWVQQIIDILNDPDQTQFKSQFYTNFKKYFQSYGILFKDNDNNLNMKIINENENVDVLINSAYEALANRSNGSSNLFDKSNHVKSDNIDRLLVIADAIGHDKSMHENAILIQEIFQKLNIPFAVVSEIESSLTRNDINNIPLKLKRLIALINGVNSESALYGLVKTSEFKYFASLSNKSYTNGLESMSYESGKLYYSYVMPSFLNMYIGQLKGNIDSNITYQDFLEEQFGQYAWFKKNGKWRNEWVKRLATDDEARDVLRHKVQLNNQGVEYDSKSPIQYIESVVKEFFYDPSKNYAWYRVPIMSNKPSEEYIRFYRIHQGYKSEISDKLVQVAYQEIDRIIAVKQRKNAPNKIDRFDGKRGERFCILDFLNGNKIIDKYINDKIHELQDKDRIADNSELVTELHRAIDEYFVQKIEETKQKWIEIGFLGQDNSGNLISPTNINLGSSTEEIIDSISEFVYNDTFAAINILELTITDPAFYKDSEDLQKRLAQIHAPGMRPDLLAYDKFNQQKYSDGKFRTIILKDFDHQKSAILKDLEDVFNDMIEKETNDVRRSVLKAKKEQVLKAFADINIADGQGYSSPSSYRKKMGLFGKWGQREEDAYQKILDGNFTDVDLDIAFQPLKPFVFGFTTRNGYNNVMPKLKVGIQCKNSEYLVIMADALLRSAGKTNYLTSIFDVMEESYGLVKHGNKWIGKPNQTGIDTVQFESAIKTGNTGGIDLSDNAISKFRAEHNIKQSVSNEEVAKLIIQSNIYNQDNTYNTDVVAVTSFNNYAIQQEVPTHFKYEQQHGSQVRILLFSGLEDSEQLTYTTYEQKVGADGNVIIEEKQVTETVGQAKQRYYNAIVENINESIQQLTNELHLSSADKYERNIVLSRILRQKILEDARFDANLLYACTVNNNGEFNIPLSDPVQADRIMKLLNSLIKNNVNKQKVAGGPVVQVSRFGSKDLSIRFKDKNNNILLTKQEFDDFVLHNKVPKVHFDKSLINKTSAKKNLDSAYEEYMRANKFATAYMECYAPIYDDNLLTDFVDDDGNIDVEKIEKTNPMLLQMVGYRIPTESHYSMIPLKIVGFLPRQSGEGIMLPDEFITMSGSDFDIDKLYIMRYELYRNEDGSYVTPPSRRARNNNTIVSTSFNVLTSHGIMEKQFTPGNFDLLKRIGYSIQAAREEVDSPNHVGFTATAKDSNTLSNAAQRYDTWMSTKDIDKIKSVGYKSKNLIDFNTQVDFHRQNMVAAKLIGIFAQANVSHSLCSMLDCKFNFDFIDSDGTKPYHNLCFKLDGHEISGIVDIDRKFGFNGTRTSDNLASCLAASVDAVKDPILNLMNINIDTANVVTTLLRLGFDLETAALVCSQQCIIDLLNKYNRENAYNDYQQTLQQFITKRLKEINVNIGPLINVNITKTFLKNNMLQTQDVQSEVAILQLFNTLLQIGQSFQHITHMTRYNSITSAVGPTSYDTDLKKIQDNDFIADGLITQKTSDQILQHPILNAFRNGSYQLEQQLLTQNLIQSSSVLFNIFNEYRNVIGTSNFKKFGDFFMSFLMSIDNAELKPIFDLSDKRINYLLNEFPNIAISLKQQYRENPFIQAIQLSRDFKSGANILSINKKIVDSEQMSSGWIDLYKSNPELAVDFAQYAFEIGSFAFSPKTFMNFLPNIVKQNLPNYIENLSEPNRSVSYLKERIVNQFLALNMISSNRIPVNLTDSINPMKITSSGSYILYRPNINPGVSKAKIGKTLIWVYLEQIEPDTYSVKQIFPGEHNGFFNIDPNSDLQPNMFNTSLENNTIQYLWSRSGNTVDLNDQQSQQDRVEAEDVFENALSNCFMTIDEIVDILGVNPNERTINRLLSVSKQDTLRNIDFESGYIKQIFQQFVNIARVSKDTNISRLMSKTKNEFNKYCQ